ncbi:DUF6086 family protein [Streptomyces sp. NRRL F-5126]|uniref:DUF6086 family protein n=1 Tax=Streptomyces sp. NRRL F-5126 TaxID=1463857 RepID=UPI0004CC70A5|nr:DUF6086 family protein [Streptomyces sp. NRRL F-5126]
MSQYYDVGDQTLWNPSNSASRLFMTQVTAHQAEVGLPSGIGPMEADECQIDPVVFAAFVNALLAWHGRTGHAVMVALSEGFVATTLVLAERANIEVNWQAVEGAERDDLPMTSDPHARGRTAALRQTTRELARHMPA